MDGQRIRKELLAERDRLNRSEQEEKSRKIEERICGLAEFKKATTVFTYVDFRSEVITTALIDRMLEMGKKVVVPLTLREERDLLPVAIRDRHRDLAPGYCAIPEPVVSLRESARVSPASIDIILLPGSVFDLRGGRMGYGGGFYDRFVSLKAPRAVRIGLAFELQVVERAPLQTHDELLDILVTEERTVRGERNA